MENLEPQRPKIIKFIQQWYIMLGAIAQLSGNMESKL